MLKVISYKSGGFTLIELIVVVAIVAVLSGLILFSVTQYINKSKDSNISANLAILIPAGEVYYNTEDANYGDGYNGFCDPLRNSVISNALSQMPSNPDGNIGCGNSVGFCCAVDTTNHQSWAACVKEFANSSMAYCVDSRGVKKDIDNSYCLNQIGGQTAFKCQ